MHGVPAPGGVRTVTAGSPGREFLEPIEGRAAGTHGVAGHQDTAPRVTGARSSAHHPEDVRVARAVSGRSRRRGSAGPGTWCASRADVDTARGPGPPGGDSRRRWRGCRLGAGGSCDGIPDHDVSRRRPLTEPETRRDRRARGPCRTRATPSRERPRPVRSVARNGLDTRPAAGPAPRTSSRNRAARPGAEAPTVTTVVPLRPASTAVGTSESTARREPACLWAVPDRGLRSEHHGAGVATVLVNRVLDALVVIRVVVIRVGRTGCVRVVGVVGVVPDCRGCPGSPRPEVSSSGVSSSGVSSSGGGYLLHAGLDPEHLVLAVTALRVRRSRWSA